MESNICERFRMSLIRNTLYTVYRIGLLEGWVNATPVMRYVLKKRMQRTTEDALQMEVAYCKISMESKTCAILIYIPSPIGETIRA